jgi:glycosyltransferase involved in cell wall biosynthesis
MQLSSFADPKKASRQDCLLRNLMLFDLYKTGHHAGYIQHLIRYWCEHKLLGKLSVVVSFNFDQDHPDIMNLVRESKVDNVEIIPITELESNTLVDRNSPFHRAYRAIQEWKLLWKYVKMTGSAHCLLMYFDSFQTPLALGLSAPCQISGIYFRPTFHYPNFQAYKASLKDKIQHYRESLILPRIFSRPQLESIFCLDPFAVKHIQEIASTASVIHLPDPVQVYQNYSPEDLAQLRQKLGIHPRRKVLLLFGALDGRKGIYQLFEAIPHLSPNICEQLTLLLAGPINEKCKSSVLSQLAEISQNSLIQVILRDEFIRDHDIQSFFEISDLVLALYQRHVGMSAILVRSATANKPVLSSDYGLMGELVKKYQLGISVDSTSPEAIANKLTKLLENGLGDLGGEKMSKFAKQHSAELFAETIFQNCE